MAEAYEIEDSIHNAIMHHVKDAIVDQIQDALPDGHPIKPGVVKIGPLLGDPMDPDEARITVMIFENDPDEKDSFQWCDEPASDDYGGLEIGGGITWMRRFTIKVDMYLERTREDVDAARRIAGSLKNRLEEVVMGLSFNNVSIEDEYVSRGAFASTIKSTVRQGGGPPDSYQFHIKLRFEVLTTKTGVLQ
jgi:hypothetical protein